MLLGFACGSMLVVPCNVGYEYEGKASYAYISQVLSAVAVGSSVGDRSAARTLRGETRAIGNSLGDNIGGYCRLH